MDLSKAFDCIYHPLLIAKLDAYGFDRSVTKFLHSYLTGRMQRVRVNSTFSSWKQVLKGVPQGSVLGPCLFNIFLNDLFGFIEKALLSNFADDNTLTICGNTILEVKRYLQMEVENVMAWFEQNFMQANANKFRLMYLNAENVSSENQLTVRDTALNSEGSAKLLGVIIDKNLNFDQHIANLCEKASCQINVLMRFKRILDTASKLQIVKSFILANFRYCSVIYHFCSRANCRKMEALLERALRYALNDNHSTYEQMLRTVKLPTLEVDRLRFIVKEVFKIQHNLAPKYLNPLIKQRHIGYGTRQRFDLEHQTYKGVKYGKHSLRVLIPKLWNDLPKKTKALDTIEEFKAAISSWNGPVCGCYLCTT